MPACQRPETLSELSRIFIVLLLADEREWETLDVAALPSSHGEMLQGTTALYMFLKPYATTHTTVVQHICNTKPLSRLGLAAVRALARSSTWHARFERVLYDMMGAMLHEQHFGTLRLRLAMFLSSPALVPQNIAGAHWGCCPPWPSGGPSAVRWLVAYWVRSWWSTP